LAGWAMLEASTDIMHSLMFSFLVAEHEVTLDADEHAKETTVEILQMLLNKFNAVGNPSSKPLSIKIIN
jgi:hypothetical protein